MRWLPSNWKEGLKRVDERRELLTTANREAGEAFAAAHFANLAETAIGARGAFYVALSGGSTPIAIYKILSSSPYLEAINWNKIHLFWSDERCVLPTDIASNYRIAMTAGLRLTGIPENQIHRMRGEDDPLKAAIAYEEEITSHIPEQIFDLVMLGMGEDGHTASLFPGSSALKAMERNVVANKVNAPQSMRLTLTLHCINKAREAVFYSFGKSKAAMVKRVLYGKDCGLLLPAQRVGTAERPSLWILDTEASAQCSF